MSKVYGCDHIKSRLESDLDETVKKYTQILQTIQKPSSIIPHLIKPTASSPTELTFMPTYLCLSCPQILPYDDRDVHDATHTFCIESTRGHIWCRNCTDYIYDPHLEDIRLLGGTKKRKYAAYISDVDAKITASNATAAPCRARGLRGLYNMGQTCFMSVVLQSLIHNPFIRTFYLGGGHRSSECEREACTSCALDDIFTEFHSTEKAEGYGAVAMLQGSWKGGGALAGYQQQDAHEYLQFILNNLHTANLDDHNNTTTTTTTTTTSTTNANGEQEEKAEDCSCVIHQTFCGILRSTVSCSKCKNVTTSLDPFIDLSLDVRSATASSSPIAPKKSNPLGLLNSSSNPNNNKKNGATATTTTTTIDLTDCLDRFTSAESLPSTEYTCRECQCAREAVKKLSLSRLPVCLPIHLKRFSHSKSTSASVKLDTRVLFPVTLDLGPYSSRNKKKTPAASKDGTKTGKEKRSGKEGEEGGGAAEDGGAGEAATPSRPVYELSSVIVHKGKMDNGHYVSYSREGDEWFLFDDSKVVLVEEREVLGAEAYMLFYVIRDID